MRRNELLPVAIFFLQASTIACFAPPFLRLSNGAQPQSAPCRRVKYPPYTVAASYGSANSTPSTIRRAHELLEASTNNDVSGWWDSLFRSPEFWSASIMLTIVALLITWEEAIKNARERLPKTLMPVVDSMLGEMGGLGFIGLFLGLFVTDGFLGEYVGFLSERWLGDEEILLETFEFLHTAFFEVAIAFFVISGLTVSKVLKEIESLTTVSKTAFDINQDGEVCLEELADALDVETLVVDIGDGELSPEEVSSALRRAQPPSFLDEVSISTRRVKAEALVVRERFLRTGQVAQTFRIETYFEKIFGLNLQEIVELSPLTWLPLIPAISLGRSIDMSRDIVSAASPNAALSSGYFLGSPLYFAVTSALICGGLAWGLWNFWKMLMIKRMLYPTLVRDSNASGSRAIILPPRYQDELLVSQFNSSPFIVGWIESFFAEPARNDQERLFGVVGAAFPEIYRNSIKFHTWLVVAQIVFYGGQVVLRDIDVALFDAPQVGDPNNLLPELAIFSFYVSLLMGQLWLAPQTFLNYCMITSIEALTQRDVLEDACCSPIGGMDTVLGIRSTDESNRAA